MKKNAAAIENLETQIRDLEAANRVLTASNSGATKQINSLTADVDKWKTRCGFSLSRIHILEANIFTMSRLLTESNASQIPAAKAEWLKAASDGYKVD